MQRLPGKFIFNSHGYNLNFLHAFQYFLPYSTSATATAISTDSFANYLVDSLGFSHHQALPASCRLSKYNKNKVNHSKFVANANSVVTFLKSHGFNDTHLRKIVCFEPRLLYYYAENTIEPKLKFLQDQGLSGSDILRVVASNPNLLTTGIDSYMLPGFQLLRQLQLSDTNVVAVLGRLGPRHFSAIVRFLMHNIDLLTSYGIPIKSIKKQIIKQPGTFLRNPEKFKEIVIRVENNLGIPRDAPVFLYGVHLLCGNSEETVETKLQMFKSFGWTQSDIDSIMVKHPKCFQLSDETIKKKLDFLMNELRLKPAYMISNSALLTYSLEKRLVPRHKVLVFLKEQGLLENCPSHSYVFRKSEPCFLTRFVIPFKEVHQLYAEHSGCNMKMLMQEGADKLSKYRKSGEENSAQAQSVAHFERKGFIGKESISR